MRPAPFALVLACLALLAGCTNKGLGSEATGRDIGKETGYRVRLIDDRERVLRPRFAGEDLGGKPWSSDDLRGKVAVVNFWASWCNPCRSEQAVLERVWREYEDRPVQFLGIDLRDTRVDAKAFVDEFDVTYPSIFNRDSSIAATFRLTVPPSTFVLDREGRVAARIIGAASDEDELRRLIDRVLAE